MFAKRPFIRTISGEVHPSHIRAGNNVRGDDLKSLTIVLKESEDNAKINGRFIKMIEDVPLDWLKATDTAE